MNSASIAIVGSDDQQAERYAGLITGLPQHGVVGRYADVGALEAEKRPSIADIVIVCEPAPEPSLFDRLRATAATEGALLVAVATPPGQQTTEASTGPDDWIPPDADDAEALRRLQILVRLKRSEDRLAAANVRIRALTAEQAAILRQAQERYRALAHNASEGVAIIDQEGTVRYITPALERLLGWSDDEARALSLFTLLHADDIDSVHAIWEDLLKSAMATAALEIRVRDRRGYWRWLRVVASNQLQVPGVYGIVLNCEDIEDRRRFAAALEASRIRYRRVLDTVQEGMWTTDERDRTTSVSPQLTVMLGYRADEILRRPPTDFMAPEDIPAYLERMAQRAQGVLDSYEQRFIRSDGSILWTRIAGSPIFDENGTYVGSLGMLQDITEQKAADAALRASVARFAALIENAPGLAVQELRRDGTIGLWNRASAEIYGHSSDEALGSRIQDLVLDPEDRRAFENVLDSIWQTGEPTPPSEWHVRHLDGTDRWVLSTMVPITVREEVECVYCMDIDITARKAAEDELRLSRAALETLNLDLERLVEQRTVALKSAIDDLDAFAFSVTHDLRAPLRAINGFSAALQEDAGPLLSGESVRYLQFITENVLLMNQLIEDLLTFSRCGRQRLSIRKLDMKAVVDQALRMQDPASLGRCEIRIGPLPEAYGDTTLTTQVMVNLLSNAVKYSHTKEQPIIEVSGVRGSDGWNTYLVQDNGIGFDMLYVDRLFAVFQRLHSSDEYDGVGVGLAICKRIIKRHGGDIWAESEPDRGAAFRFTLPATDPGERLAVDGPFDMGEESDDPA